MICRTLFIILCLIFFMVLGIGLEQLTYFSPLKVELQSLGIQLPRAKLSRRVEMMGKLGLKYAPPIDYTEFIDEKKGDLDLDKIANAYSSRLEYRKDWSSHSQMSPKKLPSSLIMDQKIISKGIPVLSVVIAENDLYHPSTGIFSNPDKKGKSWERPCFISYYDKGKLLFETGAGVRVHGGSSRKAKSKSLRLYFRDIYGHKEFKSGILFDRETEPLRKIIVRKETKFRSPLALDIAKQIGCIVPEAYPIELYLNGSKCATRFVLTEHLSKEFLVSHYGHDNYVLIRTAGSRRKKRKSNRYQKLVKWANNKNIRMTMEEVEKYVDTNNLSLWYISQFYTAGNDMYQGPALLDTSSTGSKWFWINWDMDHSFQNKLEPEKKRLWEQELNFQNVMNNPERDVNNRKTRFYHPEDPRAILFRRMRNEDSEFKNYFERLFMNVMNHKLTPEFLKSRIDYYDQVNDSFGFPDKNFINQLRLFIKHRPEYLRKLMRKYFGSPESYRCVVKGPNEMGYEVDGFISKPEYQGWYFKGSQITIKIYSKDGKNISYWLVNGEQVRSDNNHLTYTVNSETTIKPVFVQS